MGGVLVTGVFAKSTGDYFLSYPGTAVPKVSQTLYQSIKDYYFHVNCNCSRLRRRTAPPANLDPIFFTVGNFPCQRKEKNSLRLVQDDLPYQRKSL